MTDGETAPVISWRGYPTDGASVGATLTPLSAPTATVDGRPVQLRYRYGAVPTSICGVDQTGRLSLRAIGECRVTTTSVPGTYASASRMVAVRVGTGPGTETHPMWRGYPSEGTYVGATLMPLSAPTATVDGRPVQLRYRYSAAPTSVCGVDQSGRLSLRAPGECRVTATSVAGTDAPVSTTVVVRVVARQTPEITWRGYPSEGASVGATLMPLGAPTATVDGRPVQLRYRYSAAPTSVCGVDQSGRLSLRTAGECRVTATSVAGDYASASKTVTVRLAPKPEITWRGYPTDGTFVGESLTPLSAPTATVNNRPVQLRYRYGAVPTSVCGVDQTGRLSLRTEGECRVTVMSIAGDYASASKTVMVQVVPPQKPEITWRGYPTQGASVGATLMPLSAPTATVNRRPVPLQYRYSAEPTRICGVGAGGRLELRAAGECRVTATSVAGTYASASKTVVVQVVPQPKPVITWWGYPTQGASVGATLMPLSAPTATVDSRPVQLRYSYKAEPTTICGSGAGGRLELRAAGECRVTATSVAGTYASASKTVVVQVVQPQPVIRWQGYPSSGAFAGRTLSPLSAPTATVNNRPVSLQYRYSATPSSVCQVNSSGTLTLRATGTCRVTATSIAGTYAPASAPAVTVSITPSEPATPPRSGFAYCGDDTIKVWYFNRSASTRHHLNVTWQQANATFVVSWWGTIGTMSALDCGTWPAGRDYGLSDAERIADLLGIRAPKTRVPPPASGFAYCGDDTIRVYYFEPSAGTRHHLNITWQEANATFGGSWWNTIGKMSASDCGTWPLGRVYGLRDAQRIAGLPPTPTGGGGQPPVIPPGGGGSGGSTQPPPPLPEPPASRFAYCGDDTIRVWYFESTAKHHLNITGPQALEIFGGTWWGRIGSMSASDCARWPTGRTYGVSDARRIAR